MGAQVADLVADRGEQAVGRRHRPVAGVEQHEAAGAVRALALAAGEARLPEQRRVLVAQRAGHRQAGELAAGLAVDLGGGPDLRQHRPRNAHRVEQYVVPLERLEVHQHRPAGVGHVGDVAAGEVPDEPGVHRPEQRLAGLGALAQAVDVVEQPADLGPGEVGGQGQAAAVAEAVLPLVPGQLLDQVVGADVLPVDRVLHRDAGGAVPHHGRLALIGDAERDEVRHRELRLAERLLDDLPHVVPDLDGVVLDPARAGEDLVVLLLPHGHDSRALVEHDAAGRGRALVDGGDVAFRHVTGSSPRDRPEVAGDGAGRLAYV